MSIQSQITRLSANVSDAFAAIESKGVTVPSGSKSDDLADLIGQIPTGSGSAITVVDTQDEHGGIIRTISGVSLAGDTVAADKLLLGYTAHNYLGQPIVGTYQGSSNPTLKMGVIRPDAELIKTYSYDKYIVADEGITYPAYTTTSTTLKASADLTETITMSYTDYNYYILERMLSIPEYSVSTVGKGRCEYNICSYLYEIGEVEPNMFITLDGSAKKYTSRTVSVVGNGMYREFYWSSGTAVAAYSTSAYGNFFTVTAPTVASGVITLKTPVLGTRGHTTYFTNTYMNAITDVRYQWIIEVYRAPKNNLNLNGFGQTTHLAHIINCVNNNNKKLI